MAEEITAALTKVPDLRVLGRTSSFQSKGRSEDLRSIGSAASHNYTDLRPEAELQRHPATWLSEIQNVYTSQSSAAGARSAGTLLLTGGVARR